MGVVVRVPVPVSLRPHSFVVSFADFFEEFDSAPLTRADYERLLAASADRPDEVVIGKRKSGKVTDAISLVVPKKKPAREQPDVTVPAARASKVRFGADQVRTFEADEADEADEDDDEEDNEEDDEDERIWDEIDFVSDEDDDDDDDEEEEEPHR